MTKNKNFRNWWDVLPELESASSPVIAKTLKPFLKPVADCYECGVEVPTLCAKHKRRPDICVSGLLLKRLLVDLRAIWNMLLLGYTTQAGTIAAATFETSLTISCVAGNIKRAEELCNHKSGGTPWSVVEMCKIYTTQIEREDQVLKKFSDKPNNVSPWEITYAQYMWLCKLKHPTLPSVLHDALSASPMGDSYKIIASPDVRTDDLPNKVCILSITILRIHEAIADFARARELNDKDQQVIKWTKRLNSILNNLSKAGDPIIKKMKLPFNYKGQIPIQK